ncbi:MAG: hypothetical protein GX575_03725 [Candidatus Anammoximicrobium sp.]|nr:hypothetical protein [Candidatus Anammoximicrobium sp.]
MKLCSKTSPNSDGKKLEFPIQHRNYFQPKKKQTWFDKQDNKITGKVPDYPYANNCGGWTAGIWGYLVNAHREHDIFLVNDRLTGNPAYIGRILKLDEVITPERVKQVAKQIKAGMKKAGLPYWSCLEVNEKNTFHWNVLVRCPDNPENEKVISAVLRQSSGDIRCRVEKFKTKITNVSGLVAYCLKCKQPDNEGHRDRWNRKRVLFAKRTGLKKVESSTDFFKVGKGKIMAAIRATRNVENAAKTLIPSSICNVNVINPVLVEQIEGENFTIFLPKGTNGNGNAKPV